MHLKRIFVFLIAAQSLFTGCKKAAEAPNDTNNGNDTPPATAMPTPVGQPVGTAVSKTIGPGGGTISFRYGRFSSQNSSGVFELNFPNGCFEKEVQISIQPIENQCHNGKGPAFRIAAADPTITLKKPAELILTEDDIPSPNKPEVHIAVQDPVIRIWRGKRGTKDPSTGKRKYKVHRLADWALFENYHLRIYDINKLTNVQDPTNGPHIELITSQPVKMEVYRLFPNEAEIKLEDNESLMIALPFPVNVVNDRIDAIKWKFNGAVVSESHSLPPAQAIHGYFIFEGAKFETLRYTAPLVLPNSADNPLDVRIEAEIRGANNGPMAILIQRFRITNPNEYKINGSTNKNAFAECDGAAGFFSFAIRKTTNAQEEENIAFISILGAQPQPYPLTKATEAFNILSGTTVQPKKTWNHSYLDAEGNEHFSGGNFTISQVKTFSDYKIYIGTLNSSLYNYNRDTKQLSTISTSAKFEVVDRN